MGLLVYADLVRIEEDSIIRGQCTERLYVLLMSRLWRDTSMPIATVVNMLRETTLSLISCLASEDDRTSMSQGQCTQRLHISFKSRSWSGASLLIATAVDVVAVLRGITSS